MSYNKRSNYHVLFTLSRQLADGGLLTRKETDFLKELIIRQDTDLLEVASVITHPGSMDADDIKKLYKFFKHKVALHIEDCVLNLYAQGSLEDAYAIAGTDTELMSDSDSQVLVYGEVDYRSFAEILRVGVSGLDECKKFVDLGHGTGKAVIIAALVCDFETLVGIEILPGLVKASKKVLSNYNQTVAATLSDPPHISFIEGSFLDDSNDHFDADVVFANSTCFSNELMIDIAKRADKMRLGSRFISFTVKLPSPCFRVVFKQLMRMSWGDATIFVQERVDTIESMETGIVSSMVAQQTVSKPPACSSNLEGDVNTKLENIDESDSDAEEDNDLLKDLVSDVESTNALYPMDTRSDTSSLVSGMTNEDFRLDSPSVSSASGIFSPSSSNKAISTSATTGIAFQNNNASPDKTDLRSMPVDKVSSGSEDLTDDWVDVGEDFDIFDFVKKYGSTPHKK